MSFIQNRENRIKIKYIFSKFSNNSNVMPNQKIRKFFEQLGFSSDLFFHDFYYYFPKIEKGADLAYQNCLAFIDYILTPKKTPKQIVNTFKIFDKNGHGNISTAQILNLLRGQLSEWQFERYSEIISGFGPTINYIDLFQKNKYTH